MGAPHRPFILSGRRRRRGCGTNAERHVAALFVQPSRTTYILEASTTIYTKAIKRVLSTWLRVAFLLRKWI
jgi:hypothetical protein